MIIPNRPFYWTDICLLSRVWVRVWGGAGKSTWIGGTGVDDGGGDVGCVDWDDDDDEDKDDIGGLDTRSSRRYTLYIWGVFVTEGGMLGVDW